MVELRNRESEDPLGKLTPTHKERNEGVCVLRPLLSYSILSLSIRLDVSHTYIPK